MDSAGTRVKEEEEDEEEENEEEEGETTGERSGAAGTTTPTTSSSSSGGPVLCTFCGAEIRPSFKRYKYRAMEREGGGAPVERIGGRPCLIGRRAVLASTFVCAECYKRNEQLVRRPEPPPPLSARRLSSTRTAAQRTASASADDGEGEEGEEQEEDGDENRDGSEDGEDDSNEGGAQGEDDENEGDEGEEEEKEKKARGGGDDHEGREQEPEEQEGESETEGHGMTREERGRRQVEQLQLLVAAGLHREATRAAPEDALCRYVARALATFRWTLTDAGLVSARQRRAHRRRPALPAAVHAALTARSPALRLVPRDTPSAASSTDSATAPLTWALHCLFFPSFPFPLPFLFHFFFSPHMPSHPPFPIPPQQRPSTLHPPHPSRPCQPPSRSPCVAASPRDGCPIPLPNFPPFPFLLCFFSIFPCCDACFFPFPFPFRFFPTRLCRVVAFLCVLCVPDCLLFFLPLLPLSLF